MSKTFRLLIAGKSGAGKSSFCNYLVGEEHFKTGIGAPVTTWEENFQETNVGDDEFQINIVDTVGIEADNTERWLREVRSYSNRESSYLDINDWVHGVLYFVNAQAGRVEDYDIGTINMLSSLFKYSGVVVVLTHYDTANEKSLEGIEQQLSLLKVPVCGVSSVTKNLRSGKVIKPFGKETVVESVYAQSVEKVFYRVNLVVLNQLVDILAQSEKRILRHINNADWSISKIISGELPANDITLDNVLENIEEQKIDFNSKVENYLSFIRRLDENAEHYLDSQGTLDEYNPNQLIDTVYNAIDEGAQALDGRFNELAFQLESESFLKQTKAVAKAAFLVLRLKSTVKKGVEEVFSKGRLEAEKLTRKIEKNFYRNNKKLTPNLMKAYGAIPISTLKN